MLSKCYGIETYPEIQRSGRKRRPQSGHYTSNSQACLLGEYNIGTCRRKKKTAGGQRLFDSQSTAWKYILKIFTSFVSCRAPEWKAMPIAIACRFTKWVRIMCCINWTGPNTGWKWRWILRGLRVVISVHHLPRHFSRKMTICKMRQPSSIVVYRSLHRTSKYTRLRIYLTIGYY